MNNYSATGRLGSDPKTRLIERADQPDLLKAWVNIAVRSRYKDEEPTWIPVIAWGGLAKVLAEYTKKGDLIGVTGYLKQERWENDGGKYSRLVCIVSAIDLPEPKSQFETEPEEDMEF